MDTLSSFKSKLQGQQSMFTKANAESEDALKSSFIIALEFAKRSKPFTDGYFIKDCMLKVADVSFPCQFKIFRCQETLLLQEYIIYLKIWFFN